MNQRITARVAYSALLLWSWLPIERATGECTAWAAVGSRVDGGSGALIAKNRDWTNQYNYPHLIRPLQGYRHLSMYGLHGTNRVLSSTAINEKGLVVVGTAALSIITNDSGNRPVTEQLLENCSRVAQVITNLAIFSNSNFSLNYVLADREQIARIEVACQTTGWARVAVCSTTHGTLHQANHYIEPALTNFNQDPIDASSTARSHRINFLLTNSAAPLAFSNFIAFSQDQAGAPNNSIWRTGSYPPYSERTLCSWIVALTGDTPILFLKLANPDSVLQTNYYILDASFWDHWQYAVHGTARHADVDMDGDGKMDLVLFDPFMGTWHAKLSASGYAHVSGVSGGPGCTLAPGDYDGDGKTDPGVYQETNGLWTVMLSACGYAPASAILGGEGQAPAPGDFDGDRKTDLGVYQSTTGVWTVKLSGSGYAEAGTTFGGTGYMPVQRDYDGDGKVDPAVYNLTTGNWHVMLSGSGYGVVSAGGFGGAGYTPVPGDYDGDGKSDPAVYQESLGNWHVMLSASGYLIATAAGLGGPGYTALPGDYDGDGKTDPAIYNTATGRWHIMLSGSGYGIAVADPIVF